MPLKVLLSAVGTRDPHAVAPKNSTSTDGPIITVCRHVRPDIVFLFPTAEQPVPGYSSTEANGHKTIEALREIIPATKAYTRVLDLPDPTDYHQVLELLEVETSSVQEKFNRSQVEYHINVSSGTPQIQACWLLIVNGGRIKARVWQAIDPQWCEEGSARCRAVETEFVEEQNKINRVDRYLRAGMFKAAQDELELLAAGTYLPERAVKAELLARVCKAYHSWDLYQHDDAAKELEKLLPELTRYRETSRLAGKLSEQLSALREIVNSKHSETKWNLVDLLYNATRRRKAGQFADCIARFSRLYEGCYYFVIREQLKITPSTTISKQPEWVRQTLNKHGEAHLTIYDCRRLLNQKGKDPVPDSLQRELDEFKNQRNQTIIAHGMGSISQEDASRAMKLITKLVFQVFPGTDLDSYCFGEKSLDEIRQTMLKAL